MADATETEKTENARAARKTREGVVVSVGMDKTAVVTASTRKPHRRYDKTMVRSKKLFAHDENNEARVGDRVRIVETRPLSKNKHWRLEAILERAR